MPSRTEELPNYPATNVELGVKSSATGSKTWEAPALQQSKSSGWRNYRPPALYLWEPFRFFFLSFRISSRAILPAPGPPAIFLLLSWLSSFIANNGKCPD